LYVVILGTLLIGFLVASLVALINEASSVLVISVKDHQLKKNENIVEELKSKINQLELENAHLKAALRKVNIETVKEKVAYIKEGEKISLVECATLLLPKFLVTFSKIPSTKIRLQTMSEELYLSTDLNLIYLNSDRLN